VRLPVWRDFDGVAIAVKSPAFTEASGKKMYTFVSGKRVIDSRHYAEFMSTFVYLLEKGVLAKSRA
jgi:hypothetical protein